MTSTTGPELATVAGKMTHNVDWHHSRQQANWIATICYTLSDSRAGFWRHQTGIFVRTSQIVSHLWARELWLSLSHVSRTGFLLFVHFSPAPSENMIHSPSSQWWVLFHFSCMSKLHYFCDCCPDGNSLVRFHNASATWWQHYIQHSLINTMDMLSHLHKRWNDSRHR